jgi:UDP-N-acetylmuramoyl-L-alanyl-D-glutamate--2,6-diaminopimelate ligase
VARGAGAVFMENAEHGLSELSAGMPVLTGPDARAALAALACAFWGDPSRQLDLVGITGTNGKTTTAHIAKKILTMAGCATGLIGTVGYEVGEVRMNAPYTTPEAPEFQALLARMVEAGCTHAVAEASSHALAQRRVDGSRFAVGVWTNLTPEHLDYHHTMEEYFLAKRRLFDELLEGPSVLNADDPWSARLIERIEDAITYGLEDSQARLRALGVVLSPGGAVYTLAYKGDRVDVATRLVGMPNVYNALAATGACLALGLDLHDAARGLGAMETVVGRFQRIEAGQEFTCIVDYAHTPDAVERLLATVRGFAPGRIITVIGCGGDRDRTKRPLMGGAAARLSDHVVVTTDNPRSEEPEAIIAEIVAGVERGSHEVIVDRARAIGRAVGMAEPGDAVVIAGKGHEEYLDVKGVRTHFSDAEEARAAIAARMGHGGARA